jgi:hypothetical protein
MQVHSQLAFAFQVLSHVSTNGQIVSLDVGHLSFISLLITASPLPPFKSLFSYLLEELCVFSLCLSTQIRCELFSIKTLIEVEACETFEINFIRAIRSNFIDY